jgi:hypothetical protein
MLRPVHMRSRRRHTLVEPCLLHTRYDNRFRFRFVEARKQRGYTHKDPKANMKINAILFLKLIFKLFNSGIGSKINVMSSRMLNAAQV